MTGYKKVYHKIVRSKLDGEDNTLRKKNRTKEVFDVITHAE